jgi:hypothetical protein
MENFSQNKAKRGRPRLVPEYMLSLFPEHSPRSMQNEFHRLTAVQWLRDVPDFAWLLELTPHRSRYRRGTLLAEVGRLPDRETAIEAAQWLCEHTPKVTDGVAIVRRWRLSFR